MQIGIEVEGLAELTESFERLPARMKHRVRQGMSKGLELIANDAKEHARVDRGQSRASITPELAPRGLVGKVGSKLDYFPWAQELGRRAYGENWAAHLPPVAVIEEWAQRVIGRSGLGFVIARAIAQRGIPALHILENAGNRQASACVRLIAKGFDQAIKDVDL